MEIQISYYGIVLISTRKITSEKYFLAVEQLHKYCIES